MSNSKQQNNQSYKLPHGDQLREFLVGSNIKPQFLNKMLRQRGVFVNKNDKSGYVALLVRTGISYNELKLIETNLISQEATQKRQSKIIPCLPDSDSLYALLPKTFDVGQFTESNFGNITLLNLPRFNLVNEDPNHIEMLLNIERYNYNQPWTKQETQFKGSVSFKKDPQNHEIQIVTSHSCPEMKKLANQVTQQFVNDLKKSGCIAPQETLQTIQYHNFTNENRIAFLQNLSKQFMRGLHFLDIRDLGFRPDPTVECHSKVEWMQQDIANLRVRGKALGNSFFMADKSLHEFIELHTLTARYEFNLEDAEGICWINFEFDGFINGNDQDKPDAELVISVERISWRPPLAKQHETRIKADLLALLDQRKLDLYKEYREANCMTESANDAEQMTPA